MIPEIEDEAESRLSKRLLNEEPIYMPLVTVPALPEMLPVMMLLNVFIPLKVLVSARSVEEAAVIVCVSPKLNRVPLMVSEEFCNVLFGRLREDEAMLYSLPLLPPINPVSEPIVALAIVAKDA